MRFFCLGFFVLCVCMFVVVCFIAFFGLFLLSLALSLNISWSGVFTSGKDERLSSGVQELILPQFYILLFPCFWNVARRVLPHPTGNDHPTCPRYSGSITSAGRRSPWVSRRFGGFGRPNHPADGLTAQHSGTSVPPLVEGQPWDKKPPNQEAPSCQERRQRMFYKWDALAGPRKSAGAMFVLTDSSPLQAGPHWVLLCFKWEKRS